MKSSVILTGTLAAAVIAMSSPADAQLLSASIGGNSGYYSSYPSYDYGYSYAAPAYSYPAPYGYSYPAYSYPAASYYSYPPASYGYYSYPSYSTYSSPGLSLNLF